jgi:hypothetical protein
VLRTNGEVACIDDPLGGDPAKGISSPNALVNAKRVAVRGRTLRGKDALLLHDDAFELWMLERRAPAMGPQKLVDFGKVRDFSGTSCVISLEGMLACHDRSVSVGSPNPEGKKRLLPVQFDAAPASAAP